ncbi:unnamed protein product [Brassica oleracea]
MKPPIELDDENAAPPINALPSSYSLPSLSPLNTSVHVVKSTPFPVEITVEEVSIQGTHVASLSVSTPTTDESQKIKMTSTNSTATPDPRWPSKCRWSMESPPPANSVSPDNSLVPLYSSAHGNPSVTQIACNEQDDERGYMSDATANLNMSRGGRPIKPVQKFQDMEWKTVRGRGKRGRRGRGNYPPSS